MDTDLPGSGPVPITEGRRSMRGRLRAGGSFGYLLLVVMLALGVFTMYTVGHPEVSSSTA